MFFPSTYLRHVDDPGGQSLEAQNGAILVFLPPLQHDVQLIAFPFDKVGVLKAKSQFQLGVQ